MPDNAGWAGGGSRLPWIIGVGALLILLGVVGAFSAMSGPRFAPKAASGVLRLNDGSLALITCNDSGIGRARITTGNAKDPQEAVWSATLAPGNPALRILPIRTTVDGYTIVHNQAQLPDPAVVTAMRDGRNRLLTSAAFEFRAKRIGPGEVQTIDGILLDEGEFRSQPECRSR